MKTTLSNIWRFTLDTPFGVCLVDNNFRAMQATIKGPCRKSIVSCAALLSEHFDADIEVIRQWIEPTGRVCALCNIND